MPTLDEIYKQFKEDAELEYKEMEHSHCSICGAWKNGITHSRTEKACAEIERLNTELTALRAENARLRHLLFLVTTPLEKIAGSQHVPNQTADLAEDALSLIRRALEAGNA